MDGKIVLTENEVLDLASCINCFFKECLDCPRNKTKQKLLETVKSNWRKQ